ncbi:B3/4 domain-containing protein [Heyndrickxia acidicola]|uniref:Phenylalanine--tRNA ligase beta subunit-related protein n=1 Tax=Heyndrickxia acidicola TaxID=209389 RepID=A0ABU6MFC4_9BACI|nr:phenylalanine--tRNA ligase beta subunit-related protein [Heyndrickxia acidicola]MED1202994.1 phenylalanine--tRNA ligase beta subunit-related protein [Heyndrickxia acidicola]
MEIHIEDPLCRIIPKFKAGIIEYKDIVVGESPQMLRGRLQYFQESLFLDLDSQAVTELEGIMEWRSLFKATGKDPNRYRHSAEALYRRIKKQSYLPTVNTAIDINNLYSLQCQIPIGIYDADKLSGNISIRVGTSGDSYDGLNGRSNSLENIIISSDDNGAFGSPFVDSARTAVTSSTQNALQIVYLRPSMDMEEALKLLNGMSKLFFQFHGGESKISISGC